MISVLSCLTMCDLGLVAVLSRWWRCLHCQAYQNTQVQLISQSIFKRYCKAEAWLRILLESHIRFLHLYQLQYIKWFSYDNDISPDKAARGFSYANRIRLVESADVTNRCRHILTAVSVISWDAAKVCCNVIHHHPYELGRRCR